MSNNMSEQVVMAINLKYDCLFLAVSHVFCRNFSHFIMTKCVLISCLLHCILNVK